MRTVLAYSKEKIYNKGDFNPHILTAKFGAGNASLDLTNSVTKEDTNG